MPHHHRPSHHARNPPKTHRLAAPRISLDKLEKRPPRAGRKEALTQTVDYPCYCDFIPHINMDPDAGDSSVHWSGVAANLWQWGTGSGKLYTDQISVSGR